MFLMFYSQYRNVSSNSCLSKKTINSTCSFSNGTSSVFDECLPDSGLTCLSGICNCPNSTL